MGPENSKDDQQQTGNQTLGSDNQTSRSAMAVLTLSALGVVYGDIGTSPLYALRECFGHEYGLALNPQNVFGVMSLIFWTMILIICVKYMIFVLRADNKGEGGILSLMALALRTKSPVGSKGESSKRRAAILILGIFGAALLYGDGAITPAITVLSAVEGIEQVTTAFSSWVIPITCIILTGLFLLQKYGTARIGSVFGPLILVWFITIGALGIHGITLYPEILGALSPHHAVEFFLINQKIAFLVLGSVFLVVTGGEALYADMGHFGRRPIRRAWFAVVLPGLALNYLGQSALLIVDPSSIDHPFYRLSPTWGLVPLVILSTMASIIASQALITGVFSITRQAVQLGFCPRIAIVHTSSREIGQIYIPFINWTLFAAVIWLVLNFRTSSNLAAAYGIAVTLTMVITTLLIWIVAINKWKWSLPRASALFSVFLIIDFAFCFANLNKISHGGWFPLVTGLVIYLVMMTWQKGRKILYARLQERSQSVDQFCNSLIKNPPLRVAGTAIYMSGDPLGIPVPLLHNLKHNKVLHERIALLTIQTQEVPIVPKKERIRIEEIIPNFYRILAFYGFMETPKMKHILDACRSEDIHFKITETTFVLGRETILASNHPGMSIWREKIFAVMSRNAQRPTAFFRIPPNQVIEVGIQVEI